MTPQLPLRLRIGSFLPNEQNSNVSQHLKDKRENMVCPKCLNVGCRGPLYDGWENILAYKCNACCHLIREPVADKPKDAPKSKPWWRVW